MQALMAVMHGLPTSCMGSVFYLLSFAFNIILVASIGGELIIGDHVERLEGTVLVVVDALFCCKKLSGRVVTVVNQLDPLLGDWRQGPALLEGQGLNVGHKPVFE